MAKKWADNMTAHYDELSLKESVFGQLRNCIDLAVVGALIVKDQLAEKADCSLSRIVDDPNLPFAQFEIPKQVAVEDERAAEGLELGDQRLGRRAARTVGTWPPRPSHRPRSARPAKNRPRPAATGGGTSAKLPARPRSSGVEFVRL